MLRLISGGKQGRRYENRRAMACSRTSRLKVSRPFAAMTWTLAKRRSRPHSSPVVPQIAGAGNSLSQIHHLSININVPQQRKLRSSEARSGSLIITENF